MNNSLFIPNNIEGSPTRDRSPEPAHLFTDLLCSGADIIRRKLIGGNDGSLDKSTRAPADQSQIHLSRQEKRALRSLRLVEKVERIGLENIMHSSSNNSAVGIASLSVRTRISSPMTQLTSLKNIAQPQRRNDDPYAVDRETIKAILNKGLSSESLPSDTADGSTTTSIALLGELSESTLDEKKYSITEKTQNEILSKSMNTYAISKKDKQMHRQKSRRSMINGTGNQSQRPDLGQIEKKESNQRSISNGKKQSDSNDDGRSWVSAEPQQSFSFVGSISSLFFGRKGGLL